VITLIFGIHVLPSDILHSHAFLVLLTFVAINTIAYATLSMIKILPRLRLSMLRWRREDPRNRRSETRSIYPPDFDAPRS